MSFCNIIITFYWLAHHRIAGNISCSTYYVVEQGGEPVVSLLREMWKSSKASFVELGWEGVLMQTVDRLLPEA